MIQLPPGFSRLLQVSVCTLLQLCFGTVYAWSFFQTLLVRQSGWTFTETAWAFSLAIFSLGVSAAWAGQVLPRVGPRKLALAGSALFCGGYVIAGVALQLNHVPLFWLGYGVVGGIGIGMGYVTPVATVAKWFPDKKGLATGIVVMGFGVGALLLSKGLAPLLVVRVEGDLSLVFFGLAATFAVILIPASLLLSNPPPRSRAVGCVTGGAGGCSGRSPDGRRLPEDRAVPAPLGRLLLQHRRRHLDHQLPVGVAGRSLEPRGPHAGTGGPRPVRGHPDRGQFPVQRPGTPLLGPPVGPDRPG